MGGAFLAGALDAFAGYAAVDALSEGRYGVRSAVANRPDTRVVYEGLDHDPSHEDIRALLGRLQVAWEERGLQLTGITTDGSALSPAPIRPVCGAVPHHLCPFHVLKELTDGVLKAVAKERERLATSTPTLKRGRPSAKDREARRLARQSKQAQQQISDLFQDRLWFVQRRLRRAERTRLLDITRGVPV